RLASRVASANGALPGEVLQTVTLQAAQIRETRQSSLEAVSGILGDLEELAREADRLGDSARELLSGGPADIFAIAERYTAIPAALGDGSETRRSLAATAIEANRSCARMDSFAGEIENVGVRMLRLSLNAEVQAVRLQQNGTVLETVAE